MKDKHKTAYAIKQAKKAKRAPKIGPARSAGTLKSYNFRFRLTPQVMTGNNTVGALVLSNTLSPPPAGVGQAPLLSTGYITIASSNGIGNNYDLLGATDFSLTNLSYAGLYTGLFDAYKIKKITVNVEYLNNVSTVTSGSLMPTMYMYWDQDDATIPANLQLLVRKGGVRKMVFGHKSKTSYSFSFKPTVQTAMIGDAAGTVTSGTVAKAGWIDCTKPGIPHFALKYGITDIYLPGTNAVTQAFRWNFTYDIAFRAPIAAS